MPQNVSFDAGLITAGLELISPWLLPFSALVDAFLLESTSQCSTDPPPMPVFDATDVTNLIGGVLNPNLETTLTKINNALLNYAWSRFCICTDGTDPGPPPVIAPPAGVATPSANTAQPCFSGSWQGHISPNGASPGVATQINATAALVPNDGTQRSILDANNQAYTAVGIPAGVTQVIFQHQRASTQNCTDPTFDPYLILRLHDASGNELSDNLLYPGTGAAVGSETITIPSNARYWYVYSWMVNNAGCGDSIGNTLYNSQVYCSGQFPNQIQGCCPPDPAILFGIQNILKALNQISAGLPGGPVESFTDGVRHAGLTGNGTIVLQGKAAAIRVEVKTSTAGFFVNPGSPNYYYSMGFITSYAVGNPLKGWRLVYTNQVFPLASYAEEIGYTLPGGMSIDIVEQLPA